MDYKELEQAMADLDEDTVLDMMKEVMDNNWRRCQRSTGSMPERNGYSRRPV